MPKGQNRRISHLPFSFARLCWQSELPPEWAVRIPTSGSTGGHCAEQCFPRHFLVFCGMPLPSPELVFCTLGLLHPSTATRRRFTKSMAKLIVRYLIGSTTWCQNFWGCFWVLMCGDFMMVSNSRMNDAKSCTLRS